LLSVQAVHQTADSRPHRRAKIRHSELHHAANLRPPFAGKPGRQQRSAAVPVDIPQPVEDDRKLQRSSRVCTLSARRRGFAGRGHWRGCPDGVEQLSRYLDLVRRDTLLGAVCGILAAQLIKPQATCWPTTAASAA
jgi:hypothetical protein